MCNDCNDETFTAGPCADCKPGTTPAAPDDSQCEPPVAIPVPLAVPLDQNPCASDWVTLVNQNAQGNGTTPNNASAGSGPDGTGIGGSGGNNGSGGDNGSGGGGSEGSDSGGNGTLTVFYSAPMTATRTRANCGPSQIGQPYTMTLPTGSFTSTLSQANANAKAKKWLDDVAQLQANQFGNCIADPTKAPSFSDLAWVGEVGCTGGTIFTGLSWGWLSGTLETGC